MFKKIVLVIAIPLSLVSSSVSAEEAPYATSELCLGKTEGICLDYVGDPDQGSEIPLIIRKRNKGTCLVLDTIDVVLVKSRRRSRIFACNSTADLRRCRQFGGDSIATDGNCYATGG